MGSHGSHGSPWDPPWTWASGDPLARGPIGQGPRPQGTRGLGDLGPQGTQGLGDPVRLGSILTNRQANKPKKQTNKVNLQIAIQCGPALQKGGLNRFIQFFFCWFLWVLAFFSRLKPFRAVKKPFGDCFYMFKQKINKYIFLCFQFSIVNLLLVRDMAFLKPEINSP